MAAYDLSRVVAANHACAAEVGKRLHSGGGAEPYETALDQNMRDNKLQFARQYPIGVPFDGAA